MKALQNILSRVMLYVAAMVLVFSAACAEGMNTSASEPYIELSTDYPAMTVKAGDSLTFDLTLENQSGSSQEIVLNTTSIPENWTGSFSASSKEISTSPNNMPLTRMKNTAQSNNNSQQPTPSSAAPSRFPF